MKGYTKGGDEMAIETRVAQKEKLYTLLVVKKAYTDAGMKVLPELSQAIRYAMAAMQPEDIAHVEKQIAQPN